MGITCAASSGRFAKNWPHSSYAYASSSWISLPQKSPCQSSWRTRATWSFEQQVSPCLSFSVPPETCESSHEAPAGHQRTFKLFTITCSDILSIDYYCNDGIWQATRQDELHVLTSGKETVCLCSFQLSNSMVEIFWFYFYTTGRVNHTSSRYVTNNLLFCMRKIFCSFVL